ncbi:MAG: tetratricopeptide repeat protein [Candidatus Riflebacteria bacterium]|jgi:tetratricopeptide (TPR) repeat protein|nr:tetratricopeptide repeat protein [Candidatus Riflebacteria bacterium]
MLRIFLAGLLSILLPTVLWAQVSLFNEYLTPETPGLASELASFVAPGQKLDAKISELRQAAGQPGAGKSAKVDLAAFILRKVALQRNLSYEENEELILEASDLLPGDYFVESLWGDLLYYKGDYETAFSHYDNALFKKPDDIQLHGRMGLAAMQQMHYEQAITHFERVLAEKPDSFFIIYSVGRCHFELKHLEEAIESWEKALKLAKDEREKKAIEAALSQARELLASTSDSTREEDQRFVIHFAGNSQEDLGDVTFEMLEEIFFQVTDSLNFQPEVKINIIFFLTEEYYKVSREWSAGSAQGIQIMVPLKSGYKSPDYVKGLLAHEFTHTIIHLKTSNRCPLWLNEGLAQYQEFNAAYGSPETIRPDYEPLMQKEFIDKRNFVNLNQVPSLIGGSSHYDIARGYIASYLAVRCMADFYGEQTFDSLLSALGRGKSLDESMNEATGKSMADFQEEFEEWLRNL